MLESKSLHSGVRVGVGVGVMVRVRVKVRVQGQCWDACLLAALTLHLKLA